MLRRPVFFVFALLLTLCLFGCAPGLPVPPAAPPQMEEDVLPAPDLLPAPSVLPEEEAPAPDQPPASATPAPTAPVFDESALADMPQKEEYLRLRALNGEVKAWLTVPNTQIDYAAALGADNSHYLSHTLEGEYSKEGAIFFDYRTDEALSCRHLILYGHNMKAGTMFHDLGSYKHRDFFENNRILTLWAGSEKRQYEVYAAFIAAEDVYFIRESFSDDAHFLSYMNELRALSKFSTDTVLTADDQILTLCTCTYEQDNARFVVQAKRIS